MNANASAKPPRSPHELGRLVLAALIPLAAFALQWFFWAAIQPYVWFLFFPAVFFSSWIGGLRGGLVATVLCTGLVWFFFIPPRFSFAVGSPMALVSIGTFVGMGILFSISHGRLRTANRQAAEALVAARSANDQLQAANEKITRLYEQTRELDELKTQFFANVSHELRTPLTLILGPVGKRLAGADLDAAERHELEVVERNARLLYRHVSDLLDVAKLEAGRMQMRYAQADLAQLVRFVASHFEVLAGERQVRFTVDVPASLAAQVDTEKCERAVLNLLSNAFKFTPPAGAISLTLKPAGAEAVIQVQDTGPGVRADLRETIFEPFRQGEGGPDRRFGGTGLGLAIVKEFVGLHRGTVAVSEAPGGGALFTVRLPLTAPAGTEVQPGATALDREIGRQVLDELRPHEPPAVWPQAQTVATAPLVLVVEDNVDMNRYLAETLGRQYRIVTAGDGQEGLEQALALGPDLIVSDVMMPRLSGDKMVAALRQHPDRDDVPIVILTAKADDALRVQLLQAGVQDYLTKPFSAEELLARVGGLLQQRQRAKSSLRASEARFDLILQTSPNALLVVAAGGRIVRVNPQAEQLFGYAAGGLQGLAVDNLVPESARGIHAQHRQGFNAHPSARPMGVGLELSARRADGSTFPVEISLAPLTIEGSPYVIASVVDISERKRAEAEIRALNAGLERRVEERTAELRGANQELEAFAYAVSHDLRAPLRAMSGFSQALLEDCGHTLPAAAREHLDQITLASRRMGELIDGLLRLSRSTRGELQRDAVDLSALAGRLVGELAAAEPDRQIAWTVEPGLVARGDARMIEVVLANLLGNAWKYTAGTPRPAIRFFGRREAAGTWFHVADNGAGFDPRHAARLFQPFQRLHRQDEFPGLGIGLATVQRIVHRHGGVIQANATPGQGATFCFTLPSPDGHHDEPL